MWAKCLWEEKGCRRTLPPIYRPLKMEIKFCEAPHPTPIEMWHLWDIPISSVPIPPSVRRDILWDILVVDPLPTDINREFENVSLYHTNEWHPQGLLLSTNHKLPLIQFFHTPMSQHHRMLVGPKNECTTATGCTTRSKPPNHRFLVTL